MNESGEDKLRNRKVLVLRHGERLDFTFGYSWIQEKYVRKDLNMPESLPARNYKDWKHDTPLTVLGEHFAQFVGSSIKSSGVKFSKVFVSPSFRCLQTATGILKGMGLENELPLNIEPGFFEWTGYYGRLPNLLTVDEASELFNVNSGYRPYMNQNKLQKKSNESIEDHYERSHKTTREVLKNCEGDVLIVAHAGSLESCTRQLIGKEKRPDAFQDLVDMIPYLGAIALKQNGDSFKPIEPPCVTITNDALKKVNLGDWNPHRYSTKYNFRIFFDKN